MTTLFLDPVKEGKNEKVVKYHQATTLVPQQMTRA